jgi:hypothetical protein
MVNNTQPFPQTMVPFYDFEGTRGYQPSRPKAGPSLPTRQPVADSVSLSSEALAANPYSGIAAGSTLVKVDAWGQGKNDCLEHILKNQGYSTAEIYAKGSDGKTLLQHVSAANKLKNPNLIHPGQSLVIPARKAAGEQQQQAPKTNAGVAGPRSANMEGVGIFQQPGGLAVNADLPAGRFTDEYLMSSNQGRYRGVEMTSKTGSTRTSVQTGENDRNTFVRVSDNDSNQNLAVTVAPDRVTIVNKGRNAEETMTTSVKLPNEKAQDGFFENAGRSVAKAFGYQEETPVTNRTRTWIDASSASVKTTPDGRTTVSMKQNGDSHVLRTTAGDSDDSLLERAGQAADGVVDGAKSYVKWLFS